MLSTEWLNAFAPVGASRDAGSWAAHGAGLLFHQPPLVWLVTANHVVEQVGPGSISVLVTCSRGDKVAIVPIGQIAIQHGITWVRDSVSDLAAVPMPITVEVNIKALTEKNCLRLADLIPSMPCFTIGCPYGLHGVDPTRATPLVLDGVIAGVDPRGRRIFTSAPTFPGNSGGPLIAVRSPFTPAGDRMMVGRATVLLAGVMLQSLLVPNPSSSSIPPLHLGIATPTDAILDLLATADARDAVKRLAPNSSNRQPGPS